MNTCPGCGAKLNRTQTMLDGDPEWECGSCMVGEVPHISWTCRAIAAERLVGQLAAEIAELRERLK